MLSLLNTKSELYTFLRVVLRQVLVAPLLINFVIVIPMTLFLLNQRLIITKIVQRLSAMQAIELRDFRVCCPLSVIGGTIALLIRVL